MIHLDHLTRANTTRGPLVGFFSLFVGHLGFTSRQTHTCIVNTPKKQNLPKKKNIPEWTSPTPDVRAQHVRQIFSTKSSVKAHQPLRWWPVLCLYATWCSLSFPRESFLFDQCLISLTEVMAVVGQGRENLEPTVVSLSSHCYRVGSGGGDDVWLCVQCVIYKSDCTVFVLLCRKSVCIFSIKHSGFWKKKTNKQKRGPW